jgi:OOP family OmpA-OmpF porin
MKDLTKLGLTAFALAALASATAAWADGPKSVGAQPSRDQLIDLLVPHGGVVAPNERGLRVRAANPLGVASAPGDESSADSTAPAVALDVKFALNSATLTDEAKDTLRRLGAAFKSEQLSGYRFRVEGHTDAAGRPDYNKVLSLQRAQAVRDYLVSDLGVSSSRLQVVGRGQDEPLDPANPLSGVNRRVQVVNLGK